MLDMGSDGITYETSGARELGEADYRWHEWHKRVREYHDIFQGYILVT